MLGRTTQVPKRTTNAITPKIAAISFSSLLVFYSYGTWGVFLTGYTGVKYALRRYYGRVTKGERISGGGDRRSPREGGRGDLEWSGVLF